MTALKCLLSQAGLGGECAAAAWSAVLGMGSEAEKRALPSWEDQQRSCGLEG